MSKVFPRVKKHDETNFSEMRYFNYAFEGHFLNKDIHLSESERQILTGLTITTSAKSLLDDENYVAMRKTLGLEIGVNVQAHHALLDKLSNLTPVPSTIGSNQLIYWNHASQTFSALILGTGLSISGTSLNATAKGNSWFGNW